MWAKQRCQALYGPRRPLVGLGTAAPQTQLPPLSGPYPHWRKPHQHHSAGYPSRSHPGLHLPPNPLGHCSGSEAFRLIPHSFALLAVIGLQTYVQPNATCAMSAEVCSKLVGDNAHSKNNGVDVLDWQFKSVNTCAVWRRRNSDWWMAIDTASQTMQLFAHRAEAPGKHRELHCSYVGKMRNA